MPEIVAWFQISYFFGWKVNSSLGRGNWHQQPASNPARDPLDYIAVLIEKLDVAKTGSRVFDRTIKRISPAILTAKHRLVRPDFLAGNDPGFRWKIHGSTNKIFLCGFGNGLPDCWQLSKIDLGELFAQRFRHLSPQPPELFLRNSRLNLEF